MYRYFLEILNYLVTTILPTKKLISAHLRQVSFKIDESELLSIHRMQIYSRNRPLSFVIPSLNSGLQYHQSYQSVSSDEDCISNRHDSASRVLGLSSSLLTHSQQSLISYNSELLERRSLFDGPTFSGVRFLPSNIPLPGQSNLTEPEEIKFRQLPCRTFVSVGTCPYRDRCKCFNFNMALILV
jgi:hypothetical protein